MTNLRKAAEYLLEGVEAAIKAGDWKVNGACDPDSAIIALRQALNVDAVNISQECVGETAKREHEWVGLTDDEIYDYADKFLYQHGSNYGIKSFGKAIEAKLKEKNT